MPEFIEHVKGPRDFFQLLESSVGYYHDQELVLLRMKAKSIQKPERTSFVEYLLTREQANWLGKRLLDVSGDSSSN